MVIRTVVARYSGRSRLERAEIFNESFRPAPEHSVLDLGGGTGAHFASISGLRDNVTIADYNAQDLVVARATHGFNTLEIDGSGTLNIPDGAYDIVFCSSVIEHVTGPKAVVLEMTDGREFDRLAKRAQQQFAKEIRRIGRRYFVQTPNRYFPIESHSWLPGIIVALPRRWQMTVLRTLASFWPKTTEPDWRLLTVKEMGALFPDARIIRERSFGLTKSIIAVGGGTAPNDGAVER